MSDAKLKEITNKIIMEFQPEKIILFGSYAWGMPNKDSDLDLFIVKDSKKNVLDRGREVKRIIFDTDVAVDVLVYTPDQLKKRQDIGDPFIWKILNNGKVLYEQPAR